MTRFVIRLAIAQGRVDFWNLWSELTPAELATLRAAYSLDPWGDERADIRGAWHTLHLMSSFAEMKESAADELLKGLASFTEQQRHDGENEQAGTFRDAVGGLG